MEFGATMALITLPLGLTYGLVEGGQRTGVLQTVVEGLFDKVPILRKYIQLPLEEEGVERKNLSVQQVNDDDNLSEDNNTLSNEASQSIYFPEERWRYVIVKAFKKVVIGRQI